MCVWATSSGSTSEYIRKEAVAREEISQRLDIKQRDLVNHLKSIRKETGGQRKSVLWNTLIKVK